MSDIRVALLTYSTRARGGVVHTLALAEALAAAGADVTVATIARGGDTAFFRPVEPSVDVVVAPLAEREGEELGDRVERSIHALGAVCDWSTFDVVHAQDCISANAVADVDCIRTVHHLDTFTTPQLVACHERAIVAPKAHVCVSAAVAAELRDGWGIEATVIPNGVDAERFGAAAEPGATGSRARWRAEIGAPYVLAVGGVEPRKGTLDLVEAWPAFAADHPDHRLVIAGGETLFDYRPYRAEVEARIADLAVPVTQLGPVDHHALPPLVAAADALAMPSTKEGFGLAAMEGLAAGVPAVLSRLPVFEEVFGDAVVFAADGSARALGRAVASAVDRRDEERSSRGRRLAAAHSWSSTADAHLDLYRRLA